MLSSITFTYLKPEFTQTQYLFIHKIAQELYHYVCKCSSHIATPIYCTLSNYREKANLLWKTQLNHW